MPWGQKKKNPKNIKQKQYLTNSIDLKTKFKTLEKFWSYTTDRSTNHFIIFLISLSESCQYTRDIKPFRKELYINVLFLKNWSAAVRQATNQHLFLNFVFKSIEFVKYCFCFTLLALWPQGKWDLGSLIRDQTCTPCTGK